MLGRRPRRVLLLSPNIDQYRLLRATHPEATIYSSDRFLWDLSKPKSWTFDVIFAANVMHYSPAPRAWYDHVLGACELFVVQDLVNRRRSARPPFLGADGDRVRYQFRERGVISEHAHAFDLGQLQARFLRFSTYPTSTGALHFVAVLQGRLCGGAARWNPLATPSYALARLATLALLARAKLRRSP